MNLLLTIAPWVGGYLVYAVLSLFILWVFYLAVMRLATTKRERGGLDQKSTVLGTVALVIGYLLDFNANVGVMSVLLLERPRETTVTARLKRHNRAGVGWRAAVARWFEPILDPYDPSGDHI